MGGIILIVFGVVWWWKFLQPPANVVLEALLGLYLAYVWYSAGKATGLRSPWELAAGLVLLEDAFEEQRGIETGGAGGIGLPQALVALAGLIYLLDRRAPGGPRRLLIGLLVLAGGAAWHFTAGGGRVAWLLALAGLVVLYLWWDHRQQEQAGTWQFGIGLALLIAGLAIYAGYYGRLVPLMLIGTGIGELVATRATKQTA